MQLIALAIPQQEAFGALPQSMRRILGVRPRAEEQKRCLAARLSDAARDLQPASLGQCNVEHAQIPSSDALVLHLPDAVGITIVALLLSLGVVIDGSIHPGVAEWARAVVGNLNLPDLVFHGLLGLLLFAGSLHVNIAALARAGWIVLLLATRRGSAVDRALVGTALFFATSLLGSALPLMSCLIFGALISPTDPTATLGLLRKARVPQTLLTKITGEALFNDGTGVVVFLTLMSIASGTTLLTPWSVTEFLVRQVAGGLAFGLVAGFAGFLLLARRWTAAGTNPTGAPRGDSYPRSP